ncbi:hypothetical protein PR048_006265 [Dryococelus australis]|uniref:Uncharacterized protein n=1 Tax=Dryococelus australis TaxID=614101 RepID=A0ABQ9IBR2_9NEOP|nr:hypothetical protein PR048_006265 [Dryococelus australis]
MNAVRPDASEDRTYLYSDLVRSSLLCGYSKPSSAQQTEKANCVLPFLIPDTLVSNDWLLITTSQYQNYALCTPIHSLWRGL